MGLCFRVQVEGFINVRPTRNCWLESASSPYVLDTGAKDPDTSVISLCVAVLPCRLIRHPQRACKTSCNRIVSVPMLPYTILTYPLRQSLYLPFI